MFVQKGLQGSTLPAKHASSALPARGSRVAVRASPSPEPSLTVKDSRVTSSKARQVHELAEAAAPPAPSSSLSSIATNPLAIAAGVGLAGLAVKAAFDQGSRKYDGNVGEEYDAWTDEGVLEYYWGDHIHLGVYNEEERAKGYKKKDFKLAKLDFVDDMLKFSDSTNPAKVLDVGCGFGGSSRHIASKNPSAEVKGITLSPKQVERGTQLAKDRGLNNVSFQVMDALKMDFPDNTFDLVWACESGEHMPDKKKYVEEMIRVLKPGGHIVIACWCQREETKEKPFTEKDKSDLQFLYDEWAHPYFISIQEFIRLMEASVWGTGKMASTKSEDWTPQTIDSWRHSIWVGVWDPWIVVSKPHIWYKTIREIVTLERMHVAFDTGLMEYGLMAGLARVAVNRLLAQAGLRACDSKIRIRDRQPTATRALTMDAGKLRE
eukprot:gene25438-11098_t